MGSDPSVAHDLLIDALCHDDATRRSVAALSEAEQAELSLHAGIYRSIDRAMGRDGVLVESNRLVDVVAGCYSMTRIDVGPVFVWVCGMKPRPSDPDQIDSDDADFDPERVYIPLFSTADGGLARATGDNELVWFEVPDWYKDDGKPDKPGDKIGEDLGATPANQAGVKAMEERGGALGF